MGYQYFDGSEMVPMEEQTVIKSKTRGDAITEFQFRYPDAYAVRVEKVLLN